MTSTRDWGPARGDALVRQALVRTRDRLIADPRPFEALREEDLRTALWDELRSQLPGHVRKERTLTLAAFQGVGGFDLLIDSVPEVRVAWLAETKWSYTERDKIFEAAWDAVKLALAQNEHGVCRSWLITGAPEDAWRRTECPDLFADGLVDVRELWDRMLVPPGPNGGKTIGEDLEIGGRGNLFTRTPQRLATELIGTEALVRSGEHWELRVAAVSRDGAWIEDFAAPPLFPARIGQPWLEANVPGMDHERYAALLVRLRQKRWTEDELRLRVYPLRRKGAHAAVEDGP